MRGMIKKWSNAFVRGNENEILSIIIFFEILFKYPALINDPKHNAFVKFCENEIDAMPELSARQNLPRGR